MKTCLCFLFALFLVFSLTSVFAQKTYILIPQKTGKVNNKLAAELPVSLKALAAFYSAMGGTDCMDMECSLTTALGLGRQGSDAQKKLIQKYFPDDKVAALVVGQDCYLPSSSSPSFSNFQNLEFFANGENIRVNYLLTVSDHGKTHVIHGPDIYQFKNQVFKIKKRVLYAWADK